MSMTSTSSTKSGIATWNPRNVYRWTDADFRAWNQEYPYGYAYYCGHMWRPVVTGTRGNVARVIFEIVR